MKSFLHEHMTYVHGSRSTAVKKSKASKNNQPEKQTHTQKITPGEKKKKQSSIRKNSLLKKLIRAQRLGTAPVKCILRTPEKTQIRQVSFLQGKRDPQENHVERMKQKIDSDTGREMITRRFATVEPVFGNLRGNKRLHRFTLRGKAKVDGQWKLFCMMHNIEKLANHGYAR